VPTFSRKSGSSSQRLSCFFLPYHTHRKKATPSSPRGPIGFLADSEEEQHNYQNAGEGAITFSRNVCGLKRT
jgi:hypothetical protein